MYQAIIYSILSALCWGAAPLIMRSAAVGPLMMAITYVLLPIAIACGAYFFYGDAFTVNKTIGLSLACGAIWFLTRYVHLTFRNLTAARITRPPFSLFLISHYNMPMDTPSGFPETILTLVTKKHEHGDIYTFIFKPMDPARPVEFKAGQYAHVRVEGVSEGKPRRELSFASSPTDSEIWFTTHVRASSPYKQRLLTLKPGDPVVIYKIKGEFMVSDIITVPLVFIANGIGITPFRAILRDRTARNLPLPITLIHIGNAPYLYETELSLMPIEQYRIAREEIDATLAQVMKAKPDAMYYTAGSESFVRDMNEKLRTEGIPEDRIKIDEFEGYL